MPIDMAPVLKEAMKALLLQSSDKVFDMKENIKNKIIP